MANEEETIPPPPQVDSRLPDASDRPTRGLDVLHILCDAIKGLLLGTESERLRRIVQMTGGLSR